MAKKSEVKSNLSIGEHPIIKAFTLFTISGTVMYGCYLLTDMIFVQDTPSEAGQDYYDKDNVLDTGNNEIITDENGNIVTNPPLTDDEKTQYLELLNINLLDKLLKKGYSIEKIEDLISINTLPYDDNYDKISILLKADEKIYNINYIMDKSTPFEYKDEKDLISNFILYLQNGTLDSVYTSETATSTFSSLIDNLFFMGEGYYGYQINQDNPSTEFEFIYVPYFTQEGDEISAKYFWALSDRVNGDYFTILKDQIEGNYPTPIFTLVESDNQTNFNDVVEWYKNNSNKEQSIENE